MTLELVSWDDPLRSRRVYQLQDGTRFVYDYIRNDELYAHPNPRRLIAQHMYRLAEIWRQTFSEPCIAIKPTSEGQMWGWSQEDVIDGEVVEEVKAIEAAPDQDSQ